MPEQQVFRHTDFEFLMPTDWYFLEQESEPDRIVFQSSVENDQLMVSAMYFKVLPSFEEAKIAFERIVEHRREAESEIQPSPNLMDYQIVTNDSYIYTKWNSWLPSKKMRGFTLVTYENNKIYTLFFESHGTSDDHFNKMVGLICENFVTK